MTDSEIRVCIKRRLGEGLQMLLNSRQALATG